MEDRLTLLASTFDPLEAEIWCKALEEEGIAVLLRQDDPLGPLGLHLGARYEIYVFRGEERRARFVLGLGTDG